MRLPQNLPPKAPHHELRFAMLFLAFTVLFSVGALSFMNKKIVHELRQKGLQVNSLVQEVGELKSENLWLYERYSEGKKVMESIDDSLTNLQTEAEVASARKLSKTVQVLLKNGVPADVSAASTASDSTTLDILILGTHGGLTDTIMLASVNSTLKTVTLLSLPRDLVVNGRRINEYYTRYGIDPLRKEIQTITGHYPEKYAVVDLKAFVTLVDALEGIDVTVEKAIYDPYYPGPNESYQVFSLAVGPQHLDGATALKYARTRKTSSDFERAKRQQQVIEAVRAKFLEQNWLKNFDQLAEVYDSLNDSVETDVSLLEIISYAQAYSSYTLEKGNVLTSSNYLYSTISPQGAYLLLPKDPTYREILEYVRGLVGE